MSQQSGAVVVTGGASGIGEAVCRRLAADGYTVWVLDRRGEQAAETARSIGSGARSIACDVGDPAAVDAAMAEVVAAGALVGLVNNAGVGNLKALEDYTDAELDLIWRVNLAGTYHCLRAAAPHLRANGAERAGGAAVVNVASASGVRPTRGEAPYSAAKAAVIALTSAAALEWAPEVRVNCVSPGFIRTALNEVLASDDATRAGIEARTPAARLGTVEEVAALVAFLMSADAGYMTGQNLVADGGSLLTSAQMDPVLSAFMNSGAQ